MSAVNESYPEDARGAETTECQTPFNEDHLKRFAEITIEDMNRFFKKRPELERHRFCAVLAQTAADHYLYQTGFRCISLFTFFKKQQHCKDFHPLRHTRIDFGSDEFGRSSWIKHRGDIGFTGRGVNCYGRSISFKEGDTTLSAIQRYLKENKSKGAASLKRNAIIQIFPKEDLGKVIWDPKS